MEWILSHVLVGLGSASVPTVIFGFILKYRRDRGQEVLAQQHNETKEKDAEQARKDQEQSRISGAYEILIQQMFKERSFQIDKLHEQVQAFTVEAERRRQAEVRCLEENQKMRADIDILLSNQRGG